MPRNISDLLPLSLLPVGSIARVRQILGGRQTVRQLLGLGLRVGEELEVLHRRGHSVVIGSQGNRVAIGESVAAQVLTVLLVNPPC